MLATAPCARIRTANRLPRNSTSVSERRAKLRTAFADSASRPACRMRASSSCLSTSAKNAQNTRPLLIFALFWRKSGARLKLSAELLDINTQASGVLLAKVVTLVLVPAQYLILDDIRGVLRRLFRADRRGGLQGIPSV